MRPAAPGAVSYIVAGKGRNTSWTTIKISICRMLERIRQLYPFEECFLFVILAADVLLFFTFGCVLK